MEICILKDQENIQQILFEFKKDLFQKTISSSKLKELSLKFSKSAVFMTISEGGEIRSSDMQHFTVTIYQLIKHFYL